MKKITLLFCLIAVGLFQANAQFETSYEESEGYALGDLNGQVGWGVSAAAPANTFEVVAENATDGDNSVRANPGDSGTLLLAFSPNDIVIEALASVSIDLNIAAGTSVTDVITQSPTQELLTTRVQFNAADNSVNVLADDGAGGLAFLPVTTFTPDTDFTFTQVLRFDDGEIEYFIDDTSVFLGSVIAATTVEQFIVGYTEGDSGFTADNLRIVNGDVTLGTDDVQLSDLKIFPNPSTTTGTVTISSRIAGEMNVAVYDVLGKQVINTITSGDLNVSTLKAGVYMVQISQEGATATKKLVVR